jgi:hypothetical protein
MSNRSRGVVAVAGLAGAAAAVTVGLLAGSGNSGATQRGAPVNTPDCTEKSYDNAATVVHDAAFVKVGEEQLTVGGILANPCGS